jgi:hypothetical protein
MMFYLARFFILRQAELYLLIAYVCLHLFVGCYIVNASIMFVPCRQGHVSSQHAIYFPVGCSSNVLSFGRSFNDEKSRLRSYQR